MKKHPLYKLALNICRELREIQLEFEYFEQVLLASNNLLFHLKKAENALLPRQMHNQFVSALGCVRECRVVLEHSKVSAPEAQKLLTTMEDAIYRKIRSSLDHLEKNQNLNNL